MKLKASVRRSLAILVVSLLTLTVIAAVYAGSIPKKYPLKAGDFCPYDIYANRSIRDKKATDLRAAKAAAEVPDVMLRQESVAASVKNRVETFFQIIGALRSNPPQPTAAPTASLPGGTTAQPTPGMTQPAVNPLLLRDAIISQIHSKLDRVIEADDAMDYAILDQSRVNSIQGQVKSLTSLIMAQTVDNAGLKNAVAAAVENLKKSVSFFQEDSGLVERTLLLLLEPNVVFDQTATENARRAAYNLVQNNPVMLEKGSRVVSMGDIITAETYEMLGELSLIDNGRFDFLHLGGISLLLFLAVGIAVFYIRHHEQRNIRSLGDYASLLLALLIPLLVSVSIARPLPLSPPVYFAAVLISAYFGFRAAAVLTLLLVVAIMPMTSYNPVFLVVALLGSLVAALYTKGVIRKDNYGFIILTTAGTNILTTISLGLLQKEEWAAIILNSGYTGISGALSVIAAIGIMPLFEMMFNTVSPLRLIDLSQPGHPLLRRLFVEAPGSSQHSMMVANLADAAAAAIGANALLARVGAYYHDIGKLENPMMFTENQEGENPHDNLTPEESANLILGHPDAGVRIARRYRLPTPVIRIIHEHHGSTAHAYFYNKALKNAENSDHPAPDLSRFQYPCPIPSSPESAIVMLADSVEAAMKSTGIHQIDEAEKLIRRLIKTKNEQDQLVVSGLSYQDVESVIQAFLQVYAGHFHERVKYPDDHPVHKPANPVSG